MADDPELIEELLHVAGRARGPASSRKRSRSKHAGSGSEESSDLEFDDSEEEDGSRSQRRNTAKRGKAQNNSAGKSRGKSAPEPADDEDDDDGYGSDLYIDEEDRRRLMAMTELDREMILADRAEERDKARQRKEIMKTANESGKSSRGRGRYSDDEEGEEEGSEASEGRGAASQQRPGARPPQPPPPPAARSQEGPPQPPPPSFAPASAPVVPGPPQPPPPPAYDEARGEAAATQGVTRQRYLEDEDDEEGDVALERQPARQRPGVGPELVTAQGEEWEDLAELEEVRSCQLTRADLEALHDKPVFDGGGGEWENEQEAATEPLNHCAGVAAEAGVAGALVRMAYGQSGVEPGTGQPIPTYWLMQVVSVVRKTSSYSFGPRQQPCNKYLQVSDGAGVVRVLSMAYASSRPIEQAELDKYNRHCGRTMRPPLSKRDIVEVKEVLDKAKSFTWDAASIRAKVEARRQAGAAPVNIAAEKQRLRRLLEAAEAAHDDPEVARLEGLLRDLDARAIAAKPGDARNFGLSHVNKRNQQVGPELVQAATPRPCAAAVVQANFNLAFKNVSNKPRTEGNVTSGAGDSQKGQSDPFSRRTTRPTIYWNTTGSRGGQAGGQASQATDADPNGQCLTVQGGAMQGGSRGTRSGPAALSGVLAVMDPVELVRVLDLEVQLVAPHALPASNPISRRLLGPRWHLSLTRHINADLNGRAVLSVEEYKQRAGLV
ncbi:hypothetical protein V8C86DRAFT_2439491 [Haematococcus lacustris]